MANPEGTFPSADADKELNPGKNKQFEVDPVSSQVAETEEQKAEAEKKLKGKKNDAVERLKSAIIITGILVALAGAIFAITKKLKEK